MYNQRNIRNFCIIAHIDHGKSTLADRLLEITKTIDKRDLHEQTLDSLDLEREKGITIKLKAVRMNYVLENENYQLNLIDTPGHVDFAYEVSRSLAACEGAVLVVDASKGIQAQTVSNMYKALEANLTIVPVINKIDLPGSNVEKVRADLCKTFGFKPEEILYVSAKSGEGVYELLEEIIKKIPAPTGAVDNPFRGLVFDTYYDDFLGVIALVKIVEGQFLGSQVKNRERIHMMATKSDSIAEGIGIMRPHRVEVDALYAGEVGFISTGFKEIKAVKVGDTIAFTKEKHNVTPLPGYKDVKPFVFVSIYPIENDKFPDLREALEKLSLSDSALYFEPESNSALGFGFRCGFLGLLHADVVQERLEREYNLELISTIPTVEYELEMTDGKIEYIKNPSDFPMVTKISQIKEPWLLINIISPSEYTGNIITLCEERRGVLRKMEYANEESVVYEYELPLAELVQNFFDELKTVSSGFASIDYEFLDKRPVKVVKMDILVHGDVIDPLSQLVLKDKAHEIGKSVVARLKDVIPRQQFQVSLQAAIGGKIIARDNLAAFRKNVLEKMSGGHRERKDKLLEIQKKGKKRMKRIGKVDIPQEAFRQVLKS